MVSRTEEQSLISDSVAYRYIVAYKGIFDPVNPWIIVDMDPIQNWKLVHILETVN